LLRGVMQNVRAVELAITLKTWKLQTVDHVTLENFLLFRMRTQHCLLIVLCVLRANLLALKALLSAQLVPVDRLQQKVLRNASTVLLVTLQTTQNVSSVKQAQCLGMVHQNV
jgi:hypothetical protein